MLLLVMSLIRWRVDSYDGNVADPFLLDDVCLLQNLIVVNFTNKSAIDLNTARYQGSMHKYFYGIVRGFDFRILVEEVLLRLSVAGKSTKGGVDSVKWLDARRMTATLSSLVASSSTSALMKCYTLVKDD